jgi:CRP-like cAMP-binding protein
VSAAFVSIWRSNVYSRGNDLFYQGNEPFALFFLCTGRVKLVRAEGGGRHKIVRIVHAPDFLGERSLIAGEPYAATAEVMDEANVCLIDAGRFKTLWLERPELARVLARQLAAKLGEAEGHVADLALRTIRERLAKHLALQARAAGNDGKSFELHESRQELAEMLGTSPEVVSRTLAELSGRKLLAIAGRGVRVLDEARLRSVARLPSLELDIYQARAGHPSSPQVASLPHNGHRQTAGQSGPRRRSSKTRRSE